MDNATTDRFKHVQRPIMINDCDVSIKEATLTLSCSRAKQECYGSLCFRFDSFFVGRRTIYSGLVTSFFSFSCLRPCTGGGSCEEKGGRPKDRKEKRTMTRCHVCGER